MRRDVLALLALVAVLSALLGLSLGSPALEYSVSCDSTACRAVACDTGRPLVLVRTNLLGEAVWGQ